MFAVKISLVIKFVGASNCPPIAKLFGSNGVTCHEGIITLKKNLKTCKGFVRELKGYWTVCTKDNKKIINW